MSKDPLIDLGNIRVEQVVIDPDKSEGVIPRGFGMPVYDVNPDPDNQRAANPFGSMWLSVPADTIISTNTTFVKLAGAFAYGSLVNFTATDDNTLTFTGSKAMVEINVCAGLAHNISGGSLLRVAIMKNGNTLIGPALATQSGAFTDANTPSNFSTTVQTPLVTDDYLEVWVALDNILKRDISLITPTSVFATIRTI